MNAEAKTEVKQTMSTVAEKTETQELQVQQDQLPQINNESSGLMNLVERMALDKEVDPGRIEQAFEMYKKVKAMESEQAFNEAMALAQAEIQPVAANKTNSHTKSVYAAIDAIHAVAKPIWTKHGFSVVTRTARSDLQNHIRVICDVRHSGGHKETHEDDWPLDNAGAQGTVNKTAIQAKGSSSTYARRYTELMIFDVAVKQMDNDGNGQANQKPAEQPITNAQIRNLRNAMKAAGKMEADVCKKAQIERIEDLPQGRLKGCLDWLQQGTQQ